MGSNLRADLVEETADTVSYRCGGDAPETLITLEKSTGRILPKHDAATRYEQEIAGVVMYRRLKSGTTEWPKSVSRQS